MNGSRPIVFVGPSLPAWEVERLLPGAVVRPPIKRGDLHVQPVAPGSVFVILDGASSLNQTITGREILDVIGNHALVVGAAGMGARLAGECWPGGMQGVGIAYRMFRAGASSADDEVTVNFDPDHPGRATVSLLNVRYATSKLRRRGRIDQAMRDRIVAAAEALAIPERRWNLILASAGVVEGAAELEQALAAFDLGGDDARRALTQLARRLRAGAAGGSREGRTSNTSGLDLKQDLLRWLFVSGRCHRYLCNPRQSAPRPPVAGEKTMTSTAMQRFFAQLGPARRPEATPGLARAHWLRRGGLSLVGDQHRTPPPTSPQGPARGLLLVAAALQQPGGTAQELWAELVARGELEREMLQLRTLQVAVAEARDNGLGSGRIHRYEAEQTIALDHLCVDWRELEELARPEAPLWAALCDYRDDLALACAQRDHRSGPGLSC